MKLYTWIYNGDFKSGMMQGIGELTFVDFDYVMHGHFVDGQYAPTAEDYLYELSKYGDYGEFSYSNDVYDYVRKHNELFPAQDSSSIPSECIESNWEYKRLKKNIDCYGTQLVKIKGTIYQIFEDTFNDAVYSAILVGDSNNDYCVVYYPDSVDLYEGDKITAYALPVANSSFENISGGTTIVIVFFGAHVS